MVNERDKKRVMIPIGTGTDMGRVVLVEGDDVPSRIENAPIAVKQADASSEASQGAKAAPITLASMSKYLKSLTSDSETGNNYKPTSESTIFKLREGPMTRIEDNVFASKDAIALLEQHGVISEMFDEATIEMLRDPTTGFNEILAHIVGNNHATILKKDGSSANISNRKAGTVDPVDASIIQKRVSSVLKRNRFNPDPTASPSFENRSTSDVDKRGLGVYQTALGAYDNTQGKGAVTYELMKKIGLALMFRATGVVTKNGDPDDFGTQAGALLPGSAQLLATRIVEPSTMYARDLKDGQGIPPGSELPPGLPSDLIIDDGSYSYGSMNSHIAQFDGFAPVATIALGVALVVAVKLLVEGFLLGIQAFTGINTGGVPRDLPRPLGYSREQTKMAGGLITLEDLGIHTVRHDYLTAVNRGIDVFFQLDAGGDYVRVIKSPGYYTVMIRAIIRSGGEIVRAFGNLSPNPITALQALSGIMDVIKTSKLIGFINVLAGLGDTVLYLEEDGFTQSDSFLSNITQELPNSKLSRIDKLPDNAITHAMKSRSGTAGSKTLDLAWRTSSTPSLYLLPPDVIKASVMLSKDKSPLSEIATLADASLSLPEDVVKRQVISKGGRIEGSDVKLIEDHLESEYVPFYFQDLRTNEIVSFHAFLASCSETFNANYDRGKYYGRVDPVMIYSDTERTINLSFNVVSTSKKDFDVMWWKINKLTTLLYPQWSKGRKVETNGDTFIQPFSQVPTSSPMIRLRLGDLFRSNYSKFALARLFGLGTDDFALAKAPSTVKTEQFKKVNEEVDKIVTRMRTNPEGKKDGVKGYAKDEKAVLKANENRPSPLLVLVPPPSVGPTLQSIKDTYTSYECDITDITTGNYVDPNGNNVEVTIYLITLVKPPDGFYSGPYAVSFNDLDINKKFVNELALKKAEITISETEQQSIEEFFSADNNVVVRAFESTRGRGLAGFVTNMSMDWKTPTWEKDFGSRAPQYCTITMAFQPIHDIAPGLDHNGFIRAPIYNVGAVMNAVGSDPYNDDEAADILQKNSEAISKSFKSKG